MGIHDRSDYDLTQHEKFSGTDLHYTDPVTNEKYIPWILETSMGLGRLFLAVLCDAYTVEKDEKGNDLPADKAIFDLKMNVDDRGSFTELLKTASCGQFSVNISKPGITKGQHWHHTKWEFFMVVSGIGRIEQRKIGTDEVLTFDVSGERIQAVQMLPGYTHNIINLSETQDLVTVMWANELFDPNKPDTFFEKV